MPDDRSPRAILPSGVQIEPHSYDGGYHGTADMGADVACVRGLPPRGDDWRLLEHTEGNRDSAFRGATYFPLSPTGDAGANLWAGEGGHVYEVRRVPTWDVNRALEGQIRRMGGFYGNAAAGEQEYAFPARVETARIKKWGIVRGDRLGRPVVDQWHKNSEYRDS